MDNTLSHPELRRMFGLDQNAIYRYINTMIGRHERYRPSEWLALVRQLRRSKIVHGRWWRYRPTNRRPDSPITMPISITVDRAVKLSDTQPKPMEFGRHPPSKPIPRADQSIWNLHWCIERFGERPAHTLVTWEKLEAIR